MSDTPLPLCPFCGVQPDVSPYRHGNVSRSISCINLSCPVMPCAHGETRAEAIERWSQRHIPAITDEDVNRAIVAGHQPVGTGNISKPRGWMRAALTAYREGLMK